MESSNINRSPKTDDLGIMIKLSTNLPAKRRLEVRIVKNRLANINQPPLPKLADVLRFRKGNKVSRIFRYIFENKKIQKTLGINLAALFLSTSLMQVPTEDTTKPENDLITQAPFVLETKKSIQYPVDPVIITQGYKFLHPGLDLDGTTGDPIRPVMDGKIEAISHSKYGYGNAILVDHGNEFTSLYAHLSKILVQLNQEVTTDTIIGEMGATGHAMGDHLHLEIRDAGKPINPSSVLHHE